jgi:hypothetical protein
MSTISNSQGATTPIDQKERLRCLLDEMKLTQKAYEAAREYQRALCQNQASDYDIQAAKKKTSGLGEQLERLKKWYYDVEKEAPEGSGEAGNIEQ